MRKIDYLLVGSSIIIYIHCYLHIYKIYAKLYGESIEHFNYYYWFTFVMLMGLLSIVLIPITAYSVGRHKRHWKRFTRCHYILAYVDGILINIWIYASLFLYSWENQSNDILTTWVFIATLANNLFYPVLLLD